MMGTPSYIQRPMSMLPKPVVVNVISVLLLFVAPLSAPAFVVEKDTSMEEVVAVMKAGQYQEYGLALTVPVGTSIKSWSVDDGVLVVQYSTMTGKVTSMSYYLARGATKSEQKPFYLTVKRFDTSTGELTIQTKRK